jgi:hypothetical protein
VLRSPFSGAMMPAPGALRAGSTLNSPECVEYEFCEVRIQHRA